ncbi:MAG: cytochrome c biogenesis protein ResB, partial [Aeromicrobium sp.]
KDGTPLRISLSPGEIADLPDGATLQFVGLRQFVKFQFSSSPLLRIPLYGISIGILGLMMSLTIKPRRTWIRVRREGSSTVVEIAVLDRVSRGDLPVTLDEFVGRFKAALAEPKDDA